MGRVDPQGQRTDRYWHTECHVCTKVLESVGSEDEAEEDLRDEGWVQSTVSVWFCNECSEDEVVLSPQNHVAADLLIQRMRQAFAQNPRGEKYRTLSQEKLYQMLVQNVSELKLALEHDNDVEDKIADVANYCAFILRNYVDAPTSKPTPVPVIVDQKHAFETLKYLETVFPQLFKAPRPMDLLESLKGTELTREQGDYIIQLVNTRVRGTRPEVQDTRENGSWTPGYYDRRN